MKLNININNHKTSIKDVYFLGGNRVRYKGIINNFTQLVVSDPHYERDVWCRYEKSIDKPETWNVEMLIKNVDEMQEYKGQKFRVQGLDFTILIKRKNIDCDLLDIGEIAHTQGITLTKTEIGIDTAQVCMGANEKAKEINVYAKKINKEKNSDKILSNYNPKFAIETMSDGTLGTVHEGIEDNEIKFIMINGFFDECAHIDSIEELKNYIVEQLNIENLEIQKENLIEDKDLDMNM